MKIRKKEIIAYVSTEKSFSADSFLNVSTTYIYVPSHSILYTKFQGGIDDNGKLLKPKPLRAERKTKYHYSFEDQGERMKEYYEDYYIPNLEAFLKGEETHWQFRVHVNPHVVKILLDKNMLNGTLLNFDELDVKEKMKFYNRIVLLDNITRRTIRKKINESLEKRSVGK